MKAIERPLDCLNNSKGKEVIIQLKNTKQIVGTLISFDININLIIDNAKELENNEVKKSLGLLFIRGDSIIYVSPNLK